MWATFQLASLVGAAVAAGGLGAFVTLYRPSPVGAAFVRLLAVVTGMNLLVVVATLTPDPVMRAYFAQLPLVFEAFIPITALLFAEKFSPSGRPPRPGTMLALAVVPVATMVLALVSPYHHLLYRRLEVDAAGVLHGDVGPWYVVEQVYLFSVLLVVALRLARPPRGAPVMYLKQRRLLLAAIVPPLVGNAFDVFAGAHLESFTIVPTIFIISVGILAWAVGRHGFLDLTGILRHDLVDHVEDAMLVVDAEGRFTDANLAGAALLGRDRDTLVGRPAAAGLPVIERLLAAAVEGSTLVPDVTLEEGAARRAYDVRVTRVRDRSGDTRGHVLLFRDVTQRHEREADIRARADRLEEVDRLKDVFLATVSHELRTPLSAVLGLADVLADERLPPHARRYVASMRSSGEMLLTLINDLLDLAKIRSGRLTLENRPFLLHEAVEPALELMVVACEKKGLVLDWHFPVTPTPIVGDVHRLRQIVLNLVANAVKFTPAGRVEVVARRDGEACELVVSDTGPGVPVALREAIFEDFNQGAESTPRTFGGTGLGLPIVRRLAQLMGGDVTVDDAPGGGARFTVRLHLPSAEAPIAPVPAPRGRALLVVEPPLRRRLVTEALTQQGFQVHPLASLNALTEALRPAPPALVWLDTGFVPADRLRAAFGDQRPNTVLELPPSALADDPALGRYPGAVLPVRRPAWIRELTPLLDNLATGRTRPTPAQGMPVAGPAHRRRILVVDDAEENLVLVKAYVRAEPVDVDVAENGRRGVEAFRSQRYDVVFLDIEMPVMNGYAALQEMRAWEASQGLSPTPIVAMTAHGGREHEARTAAAGFSHHLTRPVRKQAFLQFLGHVGAAPVPVADEAEDPAVVEVRRTYLRNLPDRLEKARTALVAGDVETLRRLGHAIRGTAGTLGLTQLAALGGELEQAARVSPAALPVLVERLATFVVAPLTDAAG